jgi:hypothetical protein
MNQLGKEITKANKGDALEMIPYLWGFLVT